MLAVCCTMDSIFSVPGMENILSMAVLGVSLEVGVISKLHLYPHLMLWLRLENTQLECYPIVRTKLDSV